ncbi:hypothetical protein UCY_03148 [Enterococcus faecalis EnGen0252]|nr:hypothetical protein SQ3_00296 [Enterococcus faecalis EnGen0212]EOI15998.1 hypothetical protein UCW_03136 [Enterococcus faecalis EnGen0248]EOI17881.1 hypothetical protein UCY_03148 [Enterococcus faecalis EnGen0252]EOI85766.1 hypothetical protein UKY_03088 [Enterococcus faecalis EnGen0294]EOJ94953.1 hypothetical protein WOK_03304 [Enterococcus faecalis EnGen0359]EOJ94999.1 hypothetical protein WOG_00309 [Enterococcus faecalis EnGen0370]EOK37685.1 hypothetical protein WUG_03118 [Enterococcus
MAKIGYSRVSSTEKILYNQLELLSTCNKN